MDPKLFLFTVLCFCVNAQWDCTSYLGNKGQCVVLSECESLNSKLMGSKRDKSVVESLKKYNCGYENNNPKVCCPDVVSTVVKNGKDCITPGGEEGTCTKLRDCSEMMERLVNKEFVTEENMDFIRRSNCTSPGSSSSFDVCCKSKLDTRSPVLPSNQCVLSALPPDPSSKCCGVESTSDIRIIGGKETAIDQFPWLVLIEYTRGYSCGGSLISGRYVLTAAHCLVGSKGKDRTAVSVRLGDYNTSNSGQDCVDTAGGGRDCTDGEISIPIESYVVHEDYDADQVLQYNDIALIRLKRNVNFTDFIRPICLPSSDFTTLSPESLSLIVAGWGIYNNSLQDSSEVKRYAVVPYYKKEQCNDDYLKRARQTLADSQLCVGGEANKDSCKGDSGGPLMLVKDLTYEAAGVVSFGSKVCGVENWPSIYTKVYDYIDWIKANIKS